MSHDLWADTAAPSSCAIAAYDPDAHAYFVARPHRAGEWVLAAQCVDVVDAVIAFHRGFHLSLDLRLLASLRLACRRPTDWIPAALRPGQAMPTAEHAGFLAHCRTEAASMRSGSTVLVPLSDAGDSERLATTWKDARGALKVTLVSSWPNDLSDLNAQHVQILRDGVQQTADRFSDWEFTSQGLVEFLDVEKSLSDTFVDRYVDVLRDNSRSAPLIMLNGLCSRALDVWMSSGCTKDPGIRLTAIREATVPGATLCAPVLHPHDGDGHWTLLVCHVEANVETGGVHLRCFELDSWADLEECYDGREATRRLVTNLRRLLSPPKPVSLLLPPKPVSWSLEYVYKECLQFPSTTSCGVWVCMWLRSLATWYRKGCPAGTCPLELPAASVMNSVRPRALLIAENLIKAKIGLCWAAADCNPTTSCCSALARLVAAAAPDTHATAAAAAASSAASAVAAAAAPVAAVVATQPRTPAPKPSGRDSAVAAVAPAVSAATVAAPVAAVVAAQPRTPAPPPSGRVAAGAAAVPVAAVVAVHGLTPAPKPSGRVAAGAAAVPVAAVVAVHGLTPATKPRRRVAAGAAAVPVTAVVAAHRRTHAPKPSGRVAAGAAAVPATKPRRVAAVAATTPAVTVVATQLQTPKARKPNPLNPNRIKIAATAAAAAAAAAAASAAAVVASAPVAAVVAAQPQTPAPPTSGRNTAVAAAAAPVAAVVAAQPRTPAPPPSGRDSAVAAVAPAVSAATVAAPVAAVEIGRAHV